MKKNHLKTSKPNNANIQLKIRSKNVTNNFILTPRTPSALDTYDPFPKSEDVRS